MSPGDKAATAYGYSRYNPKTEKHEWTPNPDTGNFESINFPADIVQVRPHARASSSLQKHVYPNP